MSGYGRVRIYSQDNLQALFGAEKEPRAMTATKNLEKQTQNRGISAHSTGSRNPMLGSTLGSSTRNLSKSRGMPRVESQQKLPSKPQTSLREHKRARLQKFWDEAQRDKLAGEVSQATLINLT